MASTVDSLRNSLKVLARVQSSENLKDTDVDQAITDAMAQHNVLYSVSTLPDVEIEAVLKLPARGTEPFQQVSAARLSARKAIQVASHESGAG